MALEIEATYENGVLKPDKPLPLQEHARVTVRVTTQARAIGTSAGIIPWNGEDEALDYLLGPENQP